jgi:hypothetical protein
MLEDHNRQSLLMMLLKCCHVFHLVLEIENMIDQLNDENSCFDIFEMIARIGELANLATKELQMF